MTSAPNARLMSHAGSTANDSKLSLFARTANACRGPRENRQHSRSVVS